MVTDSESPREKARQEASVALGEFLLELAAKHKLTEGEMSYLLSAELAHTLEFLVTSPECPECNGALIVPNGSPGGSGFVPCTRCNGTGTKSFRH